MMMALCETQMACVHPDFSSRVPFDFTSNSSDSTISEPPKATKRHSREKVSAWLRGDHATPGNPLDDLEHINADCEVRRSFYNKMMTYELEVAPVKNKMQCLLSFGEYSLFKKWMVVAEGDFVSFKPGQDSGLEHEEERRLIKKRRKVCLRDIHTLALTKNWLVMARLCRLYQVEKDSIVPGGVSLELRRLVPLRYLRICIASTAARVIGIANQNGTVKRYQMLDKADPMDENPFATWCREIGRLHPNLNDNALFVTLNTFDKWQKQHACRLTLYPGDQNDSGIGLNDWQVKLNDDKDPKLSSKEPERCLHNKNTPALITPTPLPATTSSSSDSSFVSGCQVSFGDSVPMTEEFNDPREVEGIEAKIGSNTRMSEMIESQPSSASASASYTSSGQGETVSYTDVQRSNGRRKKSLRAIFRLGFLTTKNKKKNKADGNTSPEIPSPDVGSQPLPSGSRITQRRMSRLEMNEPIEDIFSEVKFETMQKRTSTSTTDATIGDYDVTDDDDIIEDPELILKSIIDNKSSVDDVNDNLFFHDDITKLSCSEICDVIDSQSPEKQLLLPGKDCNGQLTTLSEEDPKTSAYNFR